MVTKVTKPVNSIRQRASVLKQKQTALKPKKIVVPAPKKIIKSTPKIVPKKIIKPTTKPVIKRFATPTKKPISKVAPKKILKPITRPIVKRFVKPITTHAPVKISGNMEEKLIENFISLQKVMVNLSVKFDGLSGQISKLLQLFEISAKSLAEKDFNQEKQVNYAKGMDEKVTNMFEQNKVIARGLTLLHEKMLGEEIPLPPQQAPPQQRMPAGQPQQQIPPRAPPRGPPPIRRGLPPPPRGQPPQQAPPQQSADNYEKSLSTPDPSQQQFKKLPGPSGQSV